MKYDWRQIVMELLDRQTWTQRELAAVCDSSQQSVSAWYGGRRNPTRVAQRALLEVMRQSGMEPGLYPLRADGATGPVTAAEPPAYSAEMQAMCMRMARAPRTVQQDIMSYADYRLKTAGI